MRKLHLAGLLVVSAFALLASHGCSKSNAGDPNGRPVTGTVTYKGSPVEGATVTFTSTGASAFGKTDAQGKFKLRVPGGENVLIGNYQVVIAKKETPAAAPTPSPEAYVAPNPNAPAPPAPKDLLPAKYAVAAESGLTATVTADGKNDFDFALAD